MKRRDEQGAYAVIFGLLVVVLIGIGALAVDLGNAVARKSDVQGQADFAALAAGRELTSSSTTGTPPPAVVNMARDYLNENMARNRTGCSDGNACVSSGQLTDGDLDNGEVRYANGGLQVVAPFERVDFGLARVLGFQSTDVQASATVQIKSPGGGVLPMYALDGCDQGPQSITEPSSGHSTPVTPTGLAFQTESNNASIARITAPDPARIPVTAGPGPALVLEGSSFVDAGQGPNREHVTHLGLFLENGTYHEVPVDEATRTATSVRIPAIPSDVAGFEGLWWVRVFTERIQQPADAPPVPGRWSAASNAKPLRVGNALLECAATSDEGNFGTLRIDRDDVPAGNDLAVNISESFEPPISLTIHAEATTGFCSHGISGAVESGRPNPGPNPGTNCVRTDPGLPANAAGDGLVKGAAGRPGRLDGTVHPTNPECGRSNYTVRLNNVNYPVNNDVLSCYLTNSGSTVGSIAGNYSGGTALSDDVYLSPRFFWIPVLGTAARQGGSNGYSIVDFRPGFITDESVSSMKGASDASSTNGLRVEGNNNNASITQVKVIFFNANALPSDTPGPSMDYLGTGPKLVRMID